MPQAPNSIAITGMGLFCSVADDVAAFAGALKAGRSGIARRLDETGRPLDSGVKVAATVSASRRQEGIDRHFKGDACHRKARRIVASSPASLSLTLCAALEAFRDAGLDGVLSPEAAARTGVIVAGSNLHQESTEANARRLREEGRSSPRHALTFFDTHQVGVVSELLGIRGPGMSVGAASASGNAAIFNAVQWLRSGVADRVLVVGASAGFSPLELESFALIGAAYEGADPATACAPFDASHAGFVWGEGSGALLLERASCAEGRGARSHGGLRGVSLLLDANHLPDPSREGETAAMRKALDDAGLAPGAIGYLNAHGSSSPLGDATECAAIRSLFGETTPLVNATKALTGHCISASGVIEAIATLLQLRDGFAHANLNLREPIDPVIAFAGPQASPLAARCGLSNGFGFGGFNSSLVLEAPSD